MKKLSLALTVVIALFFSLNVKAQTAPDYFIGKWNVVVIGTPQGDAKLNFTFERKDGKITGSIKDTTGKQLSTIDRVEEKDKTINVFFNIQNYDVNLLLEPIDDDHVKGNMMAMFDAKGVRVKDTDPAKK